MEKMANSRSSAHENSERSSFSFSKIMEVVARAMTKEFVVEGKEHIPKGGCLVISNHSSHFDGWALSGALSGHAVKGVQFEDAEKANEFSEKALSWLIKTFPNVSPIRRVRPVVHHVSVSDRALHEGEDSLMGRVIARGKDSEKRGADILSNITVLNSLVSDIQQGRKVIFFPEGLFFEKDNKTLRDTTRGVQILSKLYKRETGENLLILPAGVVGGESVLGADPTTNPELEVKKKGVVTVRFGEPFTPAPDNDFNDSFQEKVGALLPEEYQRIRAK